jgi:hypothetical protein
MRSENNGIELKFLVKRYGNLKQMLSGAGLRIRITSCENLYNVRNNSMSQLQQLLDMEKEVHYNIQLL